MKEMKAKRLELAKLRHYKWLKSVGLKVNMKTGHIIIKRTSQTLHIPRYIPRNSIPTSDRIVNFSGKRSYATALPEGKTISVAYNKGPYMIVDVKDFKTMGRKI
jgi:hypothetical protein